jgi:hypothetical protein
VIIGDVIMSDTEQEVNLVQWRKIPLRERNDYQYLLEVKEAYEAAYQDYKAIDDWRLIDNRCYELEIKEQAQLRKQLRELDNDNDEEGESLEEKLYQSWLKRLASDEIYYVSSEHRFYHLSKNTGRWDTMCLEAAKIYYAVDNLKAYRAFTDALREKERMKIGAVYTFNPVADDVLNLMRTDHWLHPKAGEVSVWFDILLNALSHGDQEIKDHIEHVIWWKYAHPEDYKLPCIIWHGEGGIGKTKLFIQGVLATLFGDHQILACGFDKVGGDYNGMLKGNVVVLIDEAAADKTDADVLKRIVGNPSIDVNNKFGKQETIPSTALYFAAGNKKSGVLLLEGNKTDRRWTIIKVPDGMDIMYWVMKHFGCDRDEAVKTFFDNDYVYNDLDAVAVWLHRLQEKHAITGAADKAADLGGCKSLHRQLPDSGG